MEHPGTRRFNRTTNSYVVQGKKRSASTISSILNLNIRIAYIVMIQFRLTFDFFLIFRILLEQWRRRKTLAIHNRISWISMSRNIKYKKWKMKTKTVEALFFRIWSDDLSLFLRAFKERDSTAFLKKKRPICLIQFMN